MNNAAKNGHLETVKWLHFNRSEGCTIGAMDWAAAGGHLEFIKWLYVYRSEGCSKRAMEWASEMGILKLLNGFIKIDQKVAQLQL